MTEADFNIVLPEVVLAVFAMAALLFGVYGGKDKTAPMMIWATAAIMAATGALDRAQRVGHASGLRRHVRRSTRSRALPRSRSCFLAAAVLLMSESYLAKRDLLRFEYPAAGGTGDRRHDGHGLGGRSDGALYGAGAAIAGRSTSSQRCAATSVKSTEAGLKYFVLGALSSGMLLYGASLVYGYSGTTLFSGIIQTATEGDISLGLLFGLVFLITGLAFKVSAVPFHMWTPDVYEGSPTPGHRFLRHRPQGRRDGPVRAAALRRLRRGDRRLGSGSSRFCRSPRCSLAPSPRSASATSSG